MSTTDYLLYTAMFVAILATQLGTRRPDLKRLLMPLVIVGGIGAKYLVHLPAGTWPYLLEAGGVLVGLAFGIAAVAFITVRKDPADGHLTTAAGWPYAATWLAALVLRLGFAYGSTHWFSDAIAQFSLAHQIPSATYGTAFVLMVLTMITVRTASVLTRGHHTGAHIETGNIRILNRLAR